MALFIEEEKEPSGAAEKIYGRKLKIMQEGGGCADKRKWKGKMMKATKDPNENGSKLNLEREKEARNEESFVT
jgi:hypothetical protein